MRTLLSLPPAAAKLGVQDLPAIAFAGGDPPGRQLGSGGGTAHLLAEAWRALAPAGSRLLDWIAGERTLVVHASGQSRRLPAYAAEGKARLPVPPFADAAGQVPGQTLVDAQLSDFAHLLRHAPESYCLAVACGDTLVRAASAAPVFPEADVLVVGIPSSPEEASSHGVLFGAGAASGEIELFLQKPPPARIAELAAQHPFSLDSGVWLFSRRAVAVLLAKCGWNDATQSFAGGAVAPYDLYDRFGTALGRRPANPDPEIGALSSAVLALPDGRFYHFGTNRSVIHSVAELVHPAGERRAFGHAGTGDEPDALRFLLHADAPGAEGAPGPLWIENASVPATWTLAGENVVTGVPPNAWTLSLPRGACLDAVDFAGGAALRVYGFDDAFRGRLDDPATRLLGRPFFEWLVARGLGFGEAGLDPAADLQDAPLFPVLDPAEPVAGAVAQWMAGGGAQDPAAASEARARWLAAPRVSATDLVQRADLAPRLARRAAALRAECAAFTPAAWAREAPRLDLSAVAESIRAGRLDPPPALPPDAPGLSRVHDAMLRAAAGDPAREPEAFLLLRELMASDLALTPAAPRRDTLESQIVWGRAPARLDLAGGWSDTPPWCLERGGRVVNVAVDLNGQPPIQAFAFVRAEPCVVLHSIDLGVSERIETYEQLCASSELGPFSIPRAALRLAGFDPRFAADAAPTLREQLSRRMGGGIEISTLAAIPKGSGLGTSSILAATVLGVIGDLCALGWSREDLFARTTVLEQLLGSGGGWQDQVGGLAPGAKIATTGPGLRQEPAVRYLPDGLLRDLFDSGRALLLYTGVTRVARSILGEIVRSIFLGERRSAAIIEDIARNADFATDAIQRADEAGLREAIRRSWDLNRALDAGTFPDSIRPFTDVLDRHGAAYKLLGAGGGGFLLILAPDAASASAIRSEILAAPPNPGARFVTPSLSRGLQITRS